MSPPLSADYTALARRPASVIVQYISPRGPLAMHSIQPAKRRRSNARNESSSGQREPAPASMSANWRPTSLTRSRMRAAGGELAEERLLVARDAVVAGDHE